MRTATLSNSGGLPKGQTTGAKPAKLSGSRVPHPPTAANALSASQQQQQPLLHSATTIPKGASLDPVLNLINQPATSAQYDRQVGELATCLENFKIGFSPMVAADGVPQVVGHFVGVLARPAGRSAQVEATVVPALIQLLERCAQPIVCMTLDDQRRHDAGLTALMDCVAAALYAPQQVVRVTAATTIRQVVLYIRQQCNDDVNPPPAATTYKRKEYRKCISAAAVQGCVDAWKAALGADHVDPNAAEGASPAGAGAAARQGAAASEGADAGNESDGADDLLPAAASSAAKGVASTDAISSAAAASNGGPELVALIRAVLEISHYAPLCTQLAQIGVLDAITETIRRCAAGDRRLTLCNEIVWNILSLYPESGTMITQEFVSTLMDAFVTTLSIGYKLKERELRNDIIIVFTLIAEHPRNIPFFADFVELILDLSCGPEVGAENESIPAKFHYTTHTVEQQAKALCWKLLDALCENDDFANYILDWGFVDVLLHYVDVHCEVPSVVRWSTLQLLDIQATVLHVLSHLVVIGAGHFSHADGARILYEYIAECPDLALRNLAVGVLARVATTEARSDLVAAGAIPLALQLLQEGRDNHSLLVDCLNLLADTVDRDPELQRTFAECNGVAVVLPLLCLKPSFYTDLLESVLFAAVDCVWSCVFGEASAERAFISLDGIDALLSILEDCPRWMVSFPLSCLADILQNAAAVKECREWTSARTGRSGVQVVLSLWETTPPAPPSYALRAVDDSTIETDPTSIPTVEATGLATLGTSTKNALAPQPPPSSATQQQQQQQRQASRSATEDRVVAHFERVGLDEVPEDIRPLVKSNELNFKVHAILSLVGFDSHKELSPLERGQLASVATFVELCKDEIWKNVEESLATSGVEPISSDAEKLRVLRAAADERSKSLQRTRISFQKLQERQNKEAEETFYRALIKKNDEKRATQSKSIGLSITEAKIRKAQMLKQSFKQALGRQQNSKADAGGPSEEELAAQRAAEERAEDERRRRREAEGAADMSERWGMGQRAMSNSEYAVLKALNKVRTDPLSLVPHLQQKLSYLNDEGNAFLVPGRAEAEHCVEGAAAYEEAIQFLSTVRPLVTLLDVPMGLLLAARDHAVDLGRRMEVSQDGSDGSTPVQRMQRYGKPSAAAASQMLSLGQREALDIVTQLVVDDGVANRIDRRTIFDPDVRQCGIAVGPHSIHETVCVIVTAHEYADKPAAEQQMTFAAHGGAAVPPPIQ